MLEFDHDRHLYQSDGRPVPSVTQVLHAAGLIDSTWYTDESRDRGTAVHMACHYIDEEGPHGELGNLDPEWMERSPYAGYVRAYLAFKQDAGFHQELVEKRLVHQLGYCGTVDRTGFFGQQIALGANVVLDIKTGIHEEWHRVQLAAYAACMPRPMGMRRFNLYLSNDSKKRVPYRVVERGPGQFVDDFNVFQAALIIAKFKGWKDGSGTTHRYPKAA